MLLDKENLFSEKQAVTSTEVSDNAIDLGSAGAGTGNAVKVLCQVTKSYTGTGTLAVALETAVDEAFTSPVTLALTEAVAGADLKAGYRFPLSLPESGVKRYLRLGYTVSGTLGAGEITAGLVEDVQTRG